MRGSAKIGPLIRRQGVAAFNTAAGCIIAPLVVRGVVEPEPTPQRRRSGGARQLRRKHGLRSSR
jgi:hypothetical protein